MLQALLFAAMTLIPSIGYSLEHQHIIRAGELVLRAEINAGTLDACGARETPHLIEHLLLSETAYGETPADMMLALSKHGVSLRAVTKQDYTEFVLSGPETAGEEIERAMSEILARPNLPESSVDREVDAILMELGQSARYRSKPHAFEAYSARNFGTQPPCGQDAIALKNLPHAETLAVFERLYVAENIKLVAVGPASKLSIERLASAIENARPRGMAVARITTLPEQREDVIVNEYPESGAGRLEFLIAIGGREAIPPLVAKNLAEQLRLEAMASLRRAPASYTVKSVLHQSNSGGWISLTADVSSSRLDVAITMTRNQVAHAIESYSSTAQRANSPAPSNQEIAEEAISRPTTATDDKVDEAVRASRGTIETIFSPTRSRNRIECSALLGAVALLIFFLAYWAVSLRKSK